MPPVYYKVTWGEGYEQKDLSKREALKIASELLQEYPNIQIIKYYKN